MDESEKKIKDAADSVLSHKKDEDLLSPETGKSEGRASFGQQTGGSVLDMSTSRCLLNRLQ